MRKYGLFDLYDDVPTWFLLHYICSPFFSGKDLVWIASRLWMRQFWGVRFSMSWEYTLLNLQGSFTVGLVGKKHQSGSRYDIRLAKSFSYIKVYFFSLYTTTTNLRIKLLRLKDSKQNASFTIQRLCIVIKKISYKQTM